MPELPEQESKLHQVADRRAHDRIKLRSLCYAKLGDSNGGIILDISESGCTLQAAEILVQDLIPKIRFRLPQSNRSIDAGGRIVWRGRSRKEAGVQFLDLADDARMEIRDWIFTQTIATEAPSGSNRSERVRESEAARTDRGAFGNSADERTNSNGEEIDWAGFFPGESKLNAETAPIERFFSDIGDFFPEESKLSSALAVSDSFPDIPTSPGSTPSHAAHDSVGSLAPAAAVQPAIAAPVPARAPEPAQISTVDPVVSGVDDAGSRRNLPPVDAPILHPASNRIPFSDALAASQASKSEYLASYRAEPSGPARTSWMLTAAIAFAAGLGFALLIMFGPLDFLRAELHRGLNLVNTSRIFSQDRITATNAPPPPDIFSQEAPAMHRAVNPPPEEQPRESLPKPNRKVQAPSSSEAQSSSDARVSQTESSPVSPGIQEQPGVPVGYVASNSHFLSIRMPPGSDLSEANRAVRIGRLIFSPQATYPEEALRSDVEGIVKLHVIVAPDGTILKVSSATGPPALVPSATRAIQDWRYSPTFIGKIPVESEQEITFVFRL